jgi:hypothetical protein
MAREAAPVLIAYDGSEVARAAVGHAGDLFAGRPAVVATVWSIASSVNTLRLSPPTGLSLPGPSGWSRSRKLFRMQSTWRTR